MLFAISCLDKPDHAQLRADSRPAHLDFLKSQLGHIKFAGPLLADDNQSVVGSLLIVEFGDKAGAEAFAQADPYARAGLFDSVAVRGWKQVIPGLE